MAKRSDFPRRDRDFYRSWDRRIVPPLMPHVRRGQKFVEPCAGDGVLVRQLVHHGLTCVDAWDIDPQAPGIRRIDAHEGVKTVGDDVELFITNPPWKAEWLLPLIVSLSDVRPTWLLFHADWAHTELTIPVQDRWRACVSVGRLRWIEDSAFDHTDNSAWYLFDRPDPHNQTLFYGRRP